jgi:hypothetical protein
MKIGSIPTNIVYIYSNVRTIDKQEVYPAFISDACNKKTIETGKKWAEWKNYYKPDEQHGIFEFETSNDSITKIQILSLEKRGRGGRAYKVLVHSDKLFYVDLREDVLMDVILEVGIDKKGFLKGSFIWACVDSEMKLIRVGSKLHKEMVDSTSLAKQKITKSKLEVGGVYSNKQKIAVYCGNFTTLICETKEKLIPDPKIKYNNVRVVERTFKILENYQLWTNYIYRDGNIQYWALSDIPDRHLNLPVQTLNLLVENQNYEFNFEFTKNKLIREKDNQLKVVNSVIDSLELASNELLKNMTGNTIWERACAIIHVKPINSKLPLHPEFQKYPEAVKLVEEYNKRLKCSTSTKKIT